MVKGIIEFTGSSIIEYSPIGEVVVTLVVISDVDSELKVNHLCVKTNQVSSVKDGIITFTSGSSFEGLLRNWLYAPLTDIDDNPIMHHKMHDFLSNTDELKENIGKYLMEPDIHSNIYAIVTPTEPLSKDGMIIDIKDISDYITEMILRDFKTATKDDLLEKIQNIDNLHNINYVEEKPCIWESGDRVFNLTGIIEDLVSTYEINYLYI